MRSMGIICVLLGVISLAHAKTPKAYQNGNLLQMDSVPCQGSDADFAAQTPDPASKTEEGFCQEYVLVGERTVYHIRPSDEKHTALLPLDERVQFRVQNDKLLLRAETVSAKEHEYIVVSMKPRADGSAADARPVHLNHLQ
jgi:hypothetical protein